ncbi:MAG: RNA methyltransferase [Thermoleophilia bacterium]|nr:RNA methyltransferase [Thermoleophilia bacterium]
MIREIAGRQNHSVKLARKLQKKKHRRERGLLVAEGMDLLRAAVEARAEIRDVLVRRDLVRELPRSVQEQADGASTSVVDVGVCDPETLEYASSLGGGVDVIFTCLEPGWNLGDVSLGESYAVFLDGVGDPGNVGTVIRSAVAFGGGAVICSPGTADPFSPKALRAGMGAQFVLPVVTEVSPGDLWARLRTLKEHGEAVPEVWVTDPHGGDDVRSIGRPRGVVVVLGEERTGPGADWAQARRVTIPQARFDSLNVAMAGTILAYELDRGRAAGLGGK